MELSGEKSFSKVGFGHRRERPRKWLKRRKEAVCVRLKLGPEGTEVPWKVSKVSAVPLWETGRRMGGGRTAACCLMQTTEVVLGWPWVARGGTEVV